MSTVAVQILTSSFVAYLVQIFHPGHAKLLIPGISPSVSPIATELALLYRIGELRGSPRGESTISA